MRLSILGVALLFSTAAARVGATSYYVDYQSGNDSNNGLSTSSAWQHCPGDPVATAGPAICALRPGDTIYFRGGVTYQLTGAAGIALNWDGTPAELITYDGNSANRWGSGRARFTSDYGGNALTAFGADIARHDLVFRSLEFNAIGGAALLPADPGSAVAPRYGAGIGLRGGATNVLVADCAFSELGYWFNQRPMDAASIAGAGIVCGATCRNLTIAGCRFSRVADGCDLSRATELVQLKISDCTFGGSIVWPIDFPLPASGVATNEVAIQGCRESNDGQFDPGAWSGYGNGPRVAISVVPTGATISFLASAMGSPAPSFQWFKNGIALPGASSATLRLTNLTLLDAGLYTAVATNSAGSVVSNAALLAVTPSFSTIPTAPTFTLQPISQTAVALATITFAVAASGTPAPTYQWLKNGLPVAGWTNSTLVLPGVTTNDSATYAAVATNSAGSTTSQRASLVVSDSSTVAASSSLAKVLLSAQATVGTAPASFSFSLEGVTTRQILIRALGPSLSALGLTGVLGDPRIDVYREGLRIAENDNWGGSSALRDIFSRVGALPLTDPNSKDCALVMWLPAGNYTIVISGMNGSAGLALGEAFEVP